MSVKYAAVKWNRNKQWYDIVLAGGIAIYLIAFLAISKWVAGGVSDEVLLIRAAGTGAYLLLHIVLCIGPLARLDARLLPLLYNRRHLGVATFMLGLLHGLLVTGYYHGFGKLNLVESLLTSNTNYTSVTAFPFEILGLVALLILFVMAATSHDFWQKNLTPDVWKGLHLLVYPAHALLVLHVALGALQSESNRWLALLVVGGALVVIALHLATGWRERNRDRANSSPAAKTDGANWVDVGHVDEIEDGRAKIVCLPDHERIAVFRYDGNISAVTNVCAHQRGPLGEGRVIDGCITCPWHGWEYRPQDGCSPPPFAERIPTYAVRVEHGRILLNPKELPPGTPVPPAQIGG